MSRICTSLLSILMFLALSIEAAAEQKLYKEYPNGRTDIAVLYGEKDQYFIDIFQVDPSEMQKKISSYNSSSQADIQFIFQNLHKKGFRERKSINDQSLQTFISRGRVWESKNNWNADWEKKYSEWISTVTTSTFLKNYGIAVDCADVAYAYRWIFSRINLLPAGNHFMGSDQFFTNESAPSQIANLPTNPIWHKDKRFLAALNYLLDNTYTHTLFEDSYPVAINKSSLRAGVYFLMLYPEINSGHTQLVSSVNLRNSDPLPIEVIASTVPRAVRSLWVYGFDEGETNPVENKVAFLNQRWPVKIAGRWTLIDPSKMPNYSLEQFDPDFLQGYDSLVSAVAFRLMPNWNPNYTEFMADRLALVSTKLKAREKVVADGFAYCRRTKNCEEGSAGWEAWSTYVRDEAIMDLFDQVDAIYADSRCNNECVKKYETAQSAVVLNILSQPLTLGNMKQIWNHEYFSSDPNHEIDARWGLNR